MMKTLVGMRSAFLAVVVVGALAFSCMGFAGAAWASTESTADSDLVLRIDWDNTWATGWRIKDGSSSVYVRVVSMGNFAHLYTDGSNDSGSNSVNCTLNGEANLSHPGKFTIRNYVNEWGYSQCRVTAWRDWGSSTAIYGFWSPDYSYEAGVVALN